VVAIISIVVLAVFLLASAVQAEGGAEVTTVDYRVRSGDTLWSIAETQGDQTGDVRSAVHTIQRLNGLEGSTIHAGQVLVLPSG